ncbi:helix-turn-helix transcriptional regulator [Catenulispora subtropica]|uniref:helix-turn-helix transcriptional regulator n=1 Tax=Catenulispora subtropica TaxID=450798 RepID=UPI0031E10B7C
MEQSRSRTLEQELARALRTGPFSAVLHLAIEASGLTLDEVRTRLVGQGANVSMATLSYWRRGRSRPERPESLRVVHALEKILDLPADGLISQLGPKRPRGRWLARPVGSMDPTAAYGGSPGLGELLDEVGTPVHNGMVRLAVHDLYLVGAAREELSVSTRLVVRSHVDRVSRLPVMYRQYEPDGRPPPVVRAVRGCRVGRLRSDPDSGFLVGEVVLDRVLGVGETAVVEWEATGVSRPGVDTDFYHRVFPAHVGEYVLQVQFSPEAFPARCSSYTRRTETAPDRTSQEVWVGTTGLAHVVTLDVQPGVVGLRWEWA